LSPEDLSYRLHNLEDTRLPKYVVAPADELVKPNDPPGPVAPVRRPG
jgi:hypothetical protein